MLLFIIVPAAYQNIDQPIQIHLMLLFIVRQSMIGSFSLPNSNTSHVTLYHNADWWIGDCGLFKYISCYSLSEFYRNNKKLVDYSNTSHVTLYRRHGDIQDIKSGIQIHLMLLFISPGSR